ncbi:MAG: NADH-quinone oxidoreductase subunit J [Bryobacterales bacterium]|nr:NADH-quinone oxidoreductase subunit J [Bryobacterales bacterium]
MADTFLFYAFAVMTLLGAVFTITRRNAVHSALSLIVSLLGVAGLYLLQSAEFLFAVQIVLYIGGIMVLFLFVIMLVNLDEASKQRQFNNQWLLGLVTVGLVGAQLAWFFRRAGTSLKALPDHAPAAATKLGNTEQLADVLFSEYLLPFEVASILLLVAIVGSVMMAKKKI